MEGKNRRNRLVVFTLAIVMMCVASGCGTLTFKAKVKRPAKVDMTDYKKVAIFKIENDENDVLGDALAAKLKKEEYLTVLNMREIENLVGVQELGTSNLFSAEGASKIGQLAQVDAVIFGSIKNKAWNDDQVVERQNVATAALGILAAAASDGQEQKIFWERIATASISASLNVTNVATGEVLATEIYNDSNEKRSDQGYEDPSSVPRIDSQALFNELCVAVANEFGNVISPHEEQVDVTLDDTDTSFAEFDRAVQFAKNSDWDKAAKEFKFIYETAKGSADMSNEAKAAAHYNYGVSLQYSGKLKKGLALLEAAYDANPKQLYGSQVARCKQDIENAKISKERQEKDELKSDIQ